MAPRLALVLFLFACSSPSAPEPPARDANERHPGGETSVDERGPLAFSLAARNLDAALRGSFAVGNNLFADNWVIAPSSTSSRDGLGPRHDALSCSGCHLHDGRGRIEEDGSVVSAVLRLSAPDGGPDAVLGAQLQRRAIPGLEPEGTVHVAFVARGDLLAPELQVTPARGLLTSLRVAPAMIGLGLLEAIPTEDLNRLADPSDVDGDGVSGRVNLVPDPRTGAMTVGRFGWKANQTTVERQIAAALAGDLGITSSLVTATECAPFDAACAAMPHGGVPEISDELLAHLVLYARTLAVPDARDFDDPTVLRGHAVFRAVGCDRCHAPTFETGRADIAALTHQRIWPYTDLLLHDMGEGLADGRPDHEASGSEWRTPPLWGLGLVRVVNGHDRLLHDGRARGVDEAIRWHGGEGDFARQRYEALAPADRAALVRFVESI